MKLYSWTVGSHRHRLQSSLTLDRVPDGEPGGTEMPGAMKYSLSGAIEEDFVVTENGGNKDPPGCIFVVVCTLRVFELINPRLCDG